MRNFSHMSGPDHFREAERLLKYGPGWESTGYADENQRWDIERRQCLAAAQVHATLALTAATVLRTLNGGLSPETRTEWAEATT